MVRRRLSESHSGLTFFILSTDYSIALHQKIFQLIYNSNGGFTWNDVYYMSIKLREFYWNELVRVKKSESEQIEQVNKSKGASSKVRRK